jgi:hypothetical protein
LKNGILNEENAKKEQWWNKLILNGQW